MSEGGDELGDYVRRVRENTQKYLRDLLTENEKLCALVYTLERELDAQRKDRLQIEQRITAIEAERRAYLERYLEVEAQNANVSNLYVATLRLHSTMSHADVLLAIREIVINLVGSEELAIFEMTPDGGHLRLSTSHGVETQRFDRLEVGVGTIGMCALTGRSYVSGESPSVELSVDERDLTACIPLVVENAVTGVVAIFRLLRHKPRLEPIDHELFGLLSTHAARALYCTSAVEITGGAQSLRIRATSAPPRA